MLLKLIDETTQLHYITTLLYMSYNIFISHVLPNKNLCGSGVVQAEQHMEKQEKLLLCKRFGNVCSMCDFKKFSNSNNYILSIFMLMLTFNIYFRFNVVKYCINHIHIIYAHSLIRVHKLI